MRSGRLSVFIVFALNGIVIGSWAPRMPALADQIGASHGVLGLVAARRQRRHDRDRVRGRPRCAPASARGLIVAGSALAAAVVVTVLAMVASPLQLGLALVLLGGSVGMLDVAMNVAAVTVIRRTERPLMPVFHAGFSFGALAGSVGAAFAAGHGMGLVPHFLLVSPSPPSPSPRGVIRFVPREEARRRRGRAHRRRTAACCAVPCCGCSASSRCSRRSSRARTATGPRLFSVRERGMSEAAGAVTFSVFCVAMGVVRLVGEQIERRFGAVRILVGGSLLAGLGLLLTAIVPVAWLAFVGFALAGGGLAFAFPVALDLAGAVGRRGDGTGGEREIGFVTTIAYSGFLIGPPMIGGIAQLTNLEFAIGFAGVVAMLIAPAALASAVGTQA